MNFLQELASRQRFGIKPGLDTIRRVMAALGNPERKFAAVHVAGTNGKGAVCAMLDAALRVAGYRTGRYTSPHLVSLNERFFLDGAPMADELLEHYSQKLRGIGEDLTFFEALTAVAFLAYADAKVELAVLECGLGGRLDATNVCNSRLSVITRIGLDHCDWLGDTVEQIAAEKGGIIHPGVPVVLGRNEPEVREVIERRARELGSPFHYAPDEVSDADIPESFALPGVFNRENAITALAALQLLEIPQSAVTRGLTDVVWPGRCQRIRNFIVDGAHNPPAARALAETLHGGRYHLIAGFCGDKAVDDVLAALRPLVVRAYAVKTNNPRSLSATDAADRMHAAGMAATACASLADAIALCGGEPTLICGSLFLAGEALVALGAFPWVSTRFDPSERLRGHPIADIVG